VLDLSLRCKRTETSVEGFSRNFQRKLQHQFDHPQHMTGSAKPKNGCAFCHSRPLARGAALSIPAGLSAHSQCYTCHTPGSKTGSGREMASCGACHEEKKYGRVSTNSRAFQLAFSHAQHGPKQRLDCTACHTLAAGAAFGNRSSRRAVRCTSRPLGRAAPLAITTNGHSVTILQSLQEMPHRKDI